MLFAFTSLTSSGFSWVVCSSSFYFKFSGMNILFTYIPLTGDIWIEPLNEGKLFGKR